jgi:nicotinamide mononucleotide transporter
MNNWISNNYLEIFGAITGIVYVYFEIKQTTWLWPLGLVTSAIYVYVFFISKLYADMSLQAYYVIISILGWYWWARGRMGERRNVRGGEGENIALTVSRLKRKTGIVLSVVFVTLFFIMWLALSRLTDSPVPGCDAFLTSLSIIATWMLARKIYEHWLLWIVVNTVSVILYYTRGLYPTVVLYSVYGIMSFVGLKAWKKSL